MANNKKKKDPLSKLYDDYSPTMIRKAQKGLNYSNVTAPRVRAWIKKNYPGAMGKTKKR